MYLQNVRQSLLQYGWERKFINFLSSLAMEAKSPPLSQQLSPDVGWKSLASHFDFNTFTIQP